MTTFGMSFTRKVLRPARGTANGRRRTIAVGFDVSEFNIISALAQANNVGFQEQVRQLCIAALKTADRKQGE